MNGDEDTFGARLRRLMQARGFNQSQLARRTGIDRTILNRLISGKARPRPEHVGWLAVALEVDTGELAAGAELSPDVRRAIDHVRQGADRMLRIQSERDDALARLAQAEATETRLRQQVARLERQLHARETQSPHHSQGGPSVDVDALLLT